MSPALRSHLARALLTLAPLALVACGPTYPNCDDDEQCHEGEFCVNGHCEDCRDDSQCPTGQMCESNDCVPIPGWCGSDSDCPANQRCSGDHCVARRVAASIPETMAGPQQCQLTPVYFAFDESTLDETARSTIASDRACLTERGATSVMVTGMTDPRGTEEYNLALGSRRADVVRQHLVRSGMDRRATATHTMGEENATGTEESGWSHDRRAELAPR